jgi:hypothetical protein
MEYIPSGSDVEKSTKDSTSLIARNAYMILRQLHHSRPIGKPSHQIRVLYLKRQLEVQALYELG